MNERIQELAISKGIYDCLCDPYDKHKTGDNYGSVMHDLERFAQLIVQECISIVQPSDHHQVWADGYLGGVDGLELLADKVAKIKQHFGVK